MPWECNRKEPVLVNSSRVCVSMHLKHRSCGCCFLRNNNLPASLSVCLFVCTPCSGPVVLLLLSILRDPVSSLPHSLTIDDTSSRRIPKRENERETTEPKEDNNHGGIISGLYLLATLLPSIHYLTTNQSVDQRAIQDQSSSFVKNGESVPVPIHSQTCSGDRRHIPRRLVRQSSIPDASGLESKRTGPYYPMGSPSNA